MDQAQRDQQIADAKEIIDANAQAFAEVWGELRLAMSMIAEAKGFYEEEHNPGELIALMHSELSECLEYVRKPGRDDHLPAFDGRTVELADTIIRIMDFSVRFNLPVAAALIDKALYNADRPYKHGKNSKEKPPMSLLEPRLSLRPYEYPWAVDFTKKQQQIHWLPEEVPMSKDVKDWNGSLTVSEMNLARNIMLLFTQSDIDVGNGYLDHYLRVIKNPEVRFMLTTFAAQEVIHVLAYSHLIESLGLPESTYTEFMDYSEMVEKHEHIMSMGSDNEFDLALTMAVFGGFVEGLQLFASFIMLLNFQRFGKLKGMGQIVAWSVRDETLHCAAVCQMFRTFVDENSDKSTLANSNCKWPSTAG